MVGFRKFGSDTRNRGPLTLGTLAVAWACSVFPDEVDLPDSPGAGGAAAGASGLGGGQASGGAVAEGGLGVSAAGFQSSGGAPPSSGGVSASGTGDGGTGDGGTGDGGTGDGGTGGGDGGTGGGDGGSQSLGGSGGTLGGGAGEASGGAAGAPTLSCEQPLKVTVGASADTWIDAAAPSATHGADATLRVAAGVAERRALLTLAWNASIVPQSAELFLHLNANQDALLRPRSLGVFALTRSFDESRTEWEHYGSGSSRKWTNKGADFGPSFQPLMVAAGFSSGELRVDVTPLLVAGAQQSNLIVLETDEAPPAPNELVFGSREDGVNGPRLVLTYCPQ